MVLGVLLAVVVAAVAGGVLVLDRLLLSTARGQATAFGARVGRTVTLDGVATKLWGGLGLRVTGLTVGPGPGEDRPLASLRRAEVELDLWRALTSRGREVIVREAVLEGLRLDVVRFADGTTSVERLSRRLAETAPPAAPAPPPGQPEPAATPLDVSGVRIDRAAIENARIAFLDQLVPGSKELFVDDLDLEVRDLAAGRPLTVTLAAAVLAGTQNLTLSLHAAPLPPTLAPTFTSLALHVAPLDLSPLLPFLPPSVGLRAGHLQADLAATLGAAVAGGTGPTTVKGGLAATGLAFAALETGRPFDVRVDLDVDGDATAGNLRIGTLQVVAGPASLAGQGRVTGLRGAAPRVDGLELTARGLDLEALAALAPPLRRALGEAVLDGPIGLSLRGGGSAEAQRLRLEVDLGPVRLAVPKQVAKAAGAPARLVATLDVAGNGRLSYEAEADLGGLDLRPGGTLAKAPGDVLRITSRGSARASDGTTDLSVDQVAIDLLGDRLTGKASASLGRQGGARTVRFAAEARGDRLDLDRLLIPSPKAAPAGAPEEPATVYQAKAFAGLGGTASLRLGALRTEGVEVKDVVVRITVAEDQITLTEARLAAFGGTIKADGTQVALAQAGQPVTLKLDLAGVAGKELVGFVSKYDVLDGRLDAKVALTGKGLAAKPLLQSLNGSLGGLLAGGVLKGTDLVAGVTGPLARKLPFAAKALEGSPGTSLGKELPFDLAVADGKARLVKPLSFETGRGTLQLEGAFGLDGTIDMPATLALSPEAVSALTLGRVRVTEPLPIGFRLGGPAWKPRVEGLVLDGAVKALVTAAATSALGKAGIDAGALQEKAKDVKANAEGEAKKAAADAGKKLEEEAKKKLKGLFGK